MGITPPHPLPGILLLARLYVGVDGALPEAVDDREGRLPIAGTSQRDRQMPLRAAGVDLHPGQPRVVAPEVDRGGGIPLGRHVGREEAARVKGERNTRVDRQLPLSSFFRFISPLDKLTVEPGERGEGRLDVGIDPGGPEPAEAREDRERHRRAGASTGEPGPAAVAGSHPFEAPQGRGLLVGRPVGVEEEADAVARFAFADRLADPRRLGEERLHQLRVFFERALEWLLPRGGIAPLLERCRDPRVGAGDVAGPSVGIEPREQGLDAFIGRLGDRRQSEDGIPGGIGCCLDDKRLAGDRGMILDGCEAMNSHRFRAGAAERDRHRLIDEHAPGEDWKKGLFAIGGPAGRAGGEIAQGLRAIAHAHPEDHRL